MACPRTTHMKSPANILTAMHAVMSVRWLLCAYCASKILNGLVHIKILRSDYITIPSDYFTIGIKTFSVILDVHACGFQPCGFASIFFSMNFAKPFICLYVSLWHKAPGDSLSKFTVLFNRLIVIFFLIVR